MDNGTHPASSISRADRPPRVLHLIYHLARGGSETQCVRLATALAGEGRDHRMAVSIRRGVLVPSVESACGPIFEWDIQHIRSIRTPGRVRRLARWIKEQRFDVAHAWDMDAILFGATAARMAGVPTITSRRDMGGAVPAWKRWLRDHAERRASAVVVNARAIGDQLQTGSARLPPVHCIPNLVPLPDAVAGATAEGPVRVAVVSRLVAEKGVDDVLRAFATLHDHEPRARIVVAGEGPDRSRLQQLAADLRLSGAVEFLGDVSDVFGVLRSADIGVLASRVDEGLSNAIMEYMAASLPVIAANGGGTPELVVNGKTGCLVPAKNVRALADALLQLSANPALARDMGRQGRQRLEQQYAMSTALDRFVELYRHVAETGRMQMERL